MPSQKARQTYNRKNRTTINEKNRIRNNDAYKQNPELFKQRANKWQQANPEQYLWLKARARAKRSGLEFTISKEDIFIPKFCPYLGCELTHILGKGWLHTNASLDRIDNTKGYIKGNVQVVSWLANSMKRDASKEELLRFAESVLKLYGK